MIFSDTVPLDRTSALWLVIAHAACDKIFMLEVPFAIKRSASCGYFKEAGLTVQRLVCKVGKATCSYSCDGIRKGGAGELPGDGEDVRSTVSIICAACDGSLSGAKEPFVTVMGGSCSAADADLLTDTSTCGSLSRTTFILSFGDPKFLIVNLGTNLADAIACRSLSSSISPSVESSPAPPPPLLSMGEVRLIVKGFKLCFDFMSPLFWVLIVILGTVTSCSLADSASK
ncbi:hypothetical protein GQX74_007396 [Glossina fuscipes]|nr:hypothetical protein GQX74_007396 [Glossina fuscipes]